MPSEAIISFTQPGVQSPVYVVTSLSTPPWAPLELKPSKEKTPSGDLVFEQKFGNVAEGSYQYKIRIGEGHWVVDESKESATDEHGNRNNVVHVKPANPSSALDRTADAKDTLDRKDSTMDTSDVKVGPIPFVVVEKVTDSDQPEYGDVQPKMLSVDESKRAADSEPDFEEIKADSPLDTEALELPEQAPLFRHESFQDSEASSPAMDAIEEESVQSSTDHTSSGDAINTPSAESQDEVQDEDELSHGPLLSHETGSVEEARGLKSNTHLSRETELGAEEFTSGPLFPHEIDSTPVNIDADSDYEEDEYDAAPLLPHETGSSSYKDNETANEGSRFTKYGFDYEPEHYMQYDDSSDNGEDPGELDHAPTFAHEQDLVIRDFGAPLLPHERGSVTESMSGSERSFSMSPMTYESGYPSFAPETDSGKAFFGGSMRPSFFRTRTSSSTLPDKLPRSDAEDVNLHDPGLEAFPVGREQILERVKTIGHKLPEDETHDAPTSPQPSVLSQACSSVELKPVKSYISLASVQEDSEEEEEEANADVESLPSPIYINHRSARFARDKDPLATPHPDDSKQLGFVPVDKPEQQKGHTEGSSEADSVSKTDGARDGAKGSTSLSDIVSSRATVMNTLTPPLTPRLSGALSGKGIAASVPKLDPHQPQIDATARSTPAPDEDQDVSAASSSKEASAVEKLAPGKSLLPRWNRASIGISASVAVVVAYFYLTVVR